MLLLNTKDDILKDSGNQIILVTSDFHFMDKKHRHFSKYLILCSTEERK